MDPTTVSVCGYYPTTVSVCGYYPTTVSVCGYYRFLSSSVCTQCLVVSIVFGHYILFLFDELYPSVVMYRQVVGE